METAEGNKLIAKFMGGSMCKITVKSLGEVDGAAFDYGAIPMDELPYNSDWNLLMPVIKKIYSLKLSNSITWWHICKMRITEDIDYAYKGVVDFIKLYSKLKPNEII